MSNGPKYEKGCKTCNSKFRNIIENLNIKGMSPEKIHKYLQAIETPADKAIIQKENLQPSAIRRHLDRHFDIKDGAIIKISESEAKIETSRTAYSQGVSIMVDKVNTVSHLIEIAMANLEDVELNSRDHKTKHSIINNYMTTIRGLIEQLSKLTSNLFLLK
jgi:hypothetical protein